MHFTYVPPDLTSLQQGDVLKRTSEVEAILKAVHPHYYHQGDYRYFIVLTQSCDLVRRSGGRSNARYISIAAVRPLALAVEREAQRLLYDDVERRLGFAEVSRKEKVRQFVERLLNNNEDDYFFLRKEPDVGFNEDHCAFVQLSIAVKAELHYNSLLSAKILQLSESFQHKLGYIVGKSYSRIGTEDWVPAHTSEDDFRKITQQTTDKVDGIVWLDKPTHRSVLKRLKELPPVEQTIETLREIIEEEHRGRTNKQAEVIRAVEGVLAELNVDPKLISTAKTRLANSATFRAAVK